MHNSHLTVDIVVPIYLFVYVLYRKGSRLAESANFGQLGPNRSNLVVRNPNWPKIQKVPESDQVSGFQTLQKMSEIQTKIFEFQTH